MDLNEARENNCGRDTGSEDEGDDGLLMDIVQQRISEFSIKDNMKDIINEAEKEEEDPKREGDTLGNSSTATATTVSSRRMDDYIMARYNSSLSVQDMVDTKNSQRQISNGHTSGSNADDDDLKLDTKKMVGALRASKAGMVGAHQEYAIPIPLAYLESACTLDDHGNSNTESRRQEQQHEEEEEDPNHECFCNEDTISEPNGGGGQLDDDFLPPTALSRQRPAQRQPALPGAVRIGSNTGNSNRDDNDDNNNGDNNNALDEMNIIEYVQQQLDAAPASGQVIESLQQLLANSSHFESSRMLQLLANSTHFGSHSMQLQPEPNDVGVLLEATLVNEQSNGEGGQSDQRRRSTKPLVEAVAVPVYNFTLFLEEHRWLVACFFLLLALGLGLGLGFGLSASNDDDQSKSNHPVPRQPTLQLVQERGYLKCGIGPLSPALNFWTKNPYTGEEERSGFDVGLCRAIAAAALGGAEHADKVEFSELLYEARFEGLANEVVDVLAAGTTHTMQRQVYESYTRTGFSFSVPYVYEGLQLAGDPFSVGCLENNLKVTEACRVAKVCVLGGTSHSDVLSKRLPGRSIVVVKNHQEMVDFFTDKKCSVIAHEGHQLQEEFIRTAGYRGAYVIGNSIFSKEPLALVSRKDDPEWSTFVNTVLQGLLVAEQHKITQVSAGSFPSISAFGEEYQNMIKSAISVVGHYGDLYKRFFEPIIPRKAINMLNNNTESNNGLLFSIPIGAADGDLGSASLGVVDEIKLKGTLRCGLVLDRPGFAVESGIGYDRYQGIEVELCRALGAALHEGDTFSVEFVPLSNPEEGLWALRSGELDVLAGASWNYETYIDNTAKDVAFSQPYFYRGESYMTDAQENLCLATTSKDHGWSSFVYWVVSGLIFAEESGIDSSTANQMPEINLFGAGYSRMLRDAVLAFGNFGQIYEENLEDFYPRNGTRNQLNDFLNGFPGPQHYPIPGIL